MEQFYIADFEQPHPGPAKVGVIRADCYELLFEHRNKAYGAFCLRKESDLTLANILLILIAVLWLFGLWLAGKKAVKLLVEEQVFKGQIISCPMGPVPAFVEEPMHELEKPVEVAKVDLAYVMRVNLIRFRLPVLVPENTFVLKGHLKYERWRGIEISEDSQRNAWPEQIALQNELERYLLGKTLPPTATSIIGWRSSSETSTGLNSIKQMPLLGVK